MDFPNNTTPLIQVRRKVEYRIKERPPLFHHWPVFGMHMLFVYSLSYFINVGWGFIFPSLFTTASYSPKTFSYFHFYRILCEM